MPATLTKSFHSVITKLPSTLHGVVDRLTWFQMIIEPDTTNLTIEQIRSLIEQYLSRHDEELEKIQTEQRIGRPLPRRHDEINFVRRAERDEYERAGFHLPDLAIAGNLALLKAWDGTRESLGLLKMTRIRPQ